MINLLKKAICPNAASMAAHRQHLHDQKNCAWCVERDRAMDGMAWINFVDSLPEDGRKVLIQPVSFEKYHTLADLVVNWVTDDFSTAMFAAEVYGPMKWRYFGRHGGVHGVDYPENTDE